jgi:hypothetical protein
MIKEGQIKTVMVADYCEVTINRPSGIVEVVKLTSIKELNDALFARIVKDTKKAGRGDAVSFRNVKKSTTYKVSEADAATDSSARIERMMSAGE